MELETAVRTPVESRTHDLDLTEPIDMVATQESRSMADPPAQSLAPVDPVKYAEAFGARGFMSSVSGPDRSLLEQAFDTPGPVLIGVHVDYRDNHKLFEQVNERSIH